MGEEEESWVEQLIRRWFVVSRGWNVCPPVPSSHPLKSPFRVFPGPKPNEFLLEGIQKTTGEPRQTFTSPEWCILRLIYVQLCRNNSLARQPTKSCRLCIWCASPELTPPCGVVRGGWLFVRIPIREKINKPLLGEEWITCF